MITHVPLLAASSAALVLAPRPMSHPVEACLSLLLCAACLWVLISCRHGLLATTLRAAWYWAVFSLAVLTAVEVALGISTDGTHDYAQTLRFAAAVLVFTPTMALLGAKRPQNVAWQFVVITLWGVLALPAFELWMRGRGEDLAIDAVRSWFFAVMIVVGVVNHLPTRFGLAAAQFALAQTLLLWPHLPFGGSSEGRPSVWLALGLLLTSALTARRAAKRTAHVSYDEVDSVPLYSWSFVLRDFRDWFGTVWAVRVMERVNASAAMNGWPVVLGWEGFAWRDADHSADESGSRGDAREAPMDQDGRINATQLSAEQQAAIEQSLRSLLRRFVSMEWIETRLGGCGPD